MIVIHAASLILITALITLSWIDFRTYRLPDPVTLPLIAAGLAANAFVFNTPAASLVGAAPVSYTHLTLPTILLV